MAKRPRWLPASQAGGALGLSKSAVYGRVQAGTLEAKKRNGRMVVRLPDPEPVIFEGTIDVYEVATMIGVHRNTVRVIVDRGELLMIRRGREIRFRPADIEAYIESCRVDPGTLSWARQYMDPETGRWRFPAPAEWRTERCGKGSLAGALAALAV